MRVLYYLHCVNTTNFGCVDAIGAIGRIAVNMSSLQSKKPKKIINMNELALFEGNQERIYNSQEVISALKDYLDIALLNKVQGKEQPQTPDAQFSTNQDFWTKAIRSELVAGQIVKLSNFKILEWIPSSPGLFYTHEARAKRNAAMESRSHRERQNFNITFFPQKDNKIIELIPDEKRGMIQGGYGSLRIAPKIINNELQYITCASSSGVSHEGIPISLKDNQYRKIVSELKNGKVPNVNLVGRVMVLPRELSPINLRYDEGIPKYYLDVLELDVARFSHSETSLISVAITYAAKSEFLEYQRLSYSFCSFHPSWGNTELRDAIGWLGGYAKRYSKDNQPLIVGDFDEEFDHFGNVAFPIKDIANGRIPLDKLQYFKEFFHFQINELFMGDKNIFQNSQIGAVGSNATSTNNSFQQINYSLPEDFDFEKLNGQLTILRENLAAKAKSPEEFKAIGEVAEAELASKEKDGNKVVKHLKDAGKWVFDTAKDIGVDIVTELIKKQMEL